MQLGHHSEVEPSRPSQYTRQLLLTTWSNFHAGGCQFYIDHVETSFLSFLWRIFPCSFLEYVRLVSTADFAENQVMHGNQLINI